MRLVHQIQRMGLSQELGQSNIYVMLEAVANGEEALIPVPQPPAAQRVASSAGAPGQQAMDTAPPAHTTSPPCGSAETVPEPTMALTVHCYAPWAPVPAVIAPTHGPPVAVNVPLDCFSIAAPDRQLENADMVRVPSQPTSARSSQPGFASGVGSVRLGNMHNITRRPSP